MAIICKGVGHHPLPGRPGRRWLRLGLDTAPSGDQDPADNDCREPVTTEAMVPAADLFHSLGDPNRLIILHHLQLGEHRVVDLTAHLGLSQSTVSKHLIVLRDAGVVAVRPQGRASVYSLAHPETLVELLSAAERFLGLTGGSGDPVPAARPRSGRGPLSVACRRCEDVVSWAVVRE